MTEQREANQDASLSADDVAPYLPEPGTVTVFSAEWCGHCTRLKTMLKHTGITYTEVMIERDPQAERIAIAANGGDWLIPTVIFADGSARVNPGLTGVETRLAELAETH